jgi:hypothetical protein
MKARAKLIADDQGATGIVEMLFCTSLVALVGSAENQASNSPRKLQIVNTKVSPYLQGRCSCLDDTGRSELMNSVNRRYVNSYSRPRCSVSR